MLPYETILLNQRYINDAFYELRLNIQIDKGGKEHVLRFIIQKKRGDIKSSISIRDFKMSYLTAKGIRAKKKIMRKEFFNYLENLEKLSKGEVEI